MSATRKTARVKDSKRTRPVREVPAKDKGIKIIEPIIKPEVKIGEIKSIREKVEVTTIRPEKVEKPSFTIDVITVVPLAPGCVRCIVLKEHMGMLEIHKEGDIVDLPERRFKSLGVRGLVKEYNGERQPNRRR